MVEALTAQSGSLFDRLGANGIMPTFGAMKQDIRLSCWQKETVLNNTCINKNAALKQRR
jgi:hypothetical protein